MNPRTTSLHSRYLGASSFLVTGVWQRMKSLRWKEKGEEISREKEHGYEHSLCPKQLGCHSAFTTIKTYFGKLSFTRTSPILANCTGKKPAKCFWAQSCASKQSNGTQTTDTPSNSLPLGHCSQIMQELNHRCNGRTMSPL